MGAFTYSHGLETAFQSGWITDAASLQNWLTGLLTHGSALCDAMLLAAAPGDLESIASSAFLSDIASMRHEVQYSRIFRS